MTDDMRLIVEEAFNRLVCELECPKVRLTWGKSRVQSMYYEHPKIPERSWIELANGPDMYMMHHLLHELAHHVHSTVRKSNESHDQEFMDIYGKIVKLWNGSETNYSWNLEYSHIQDWAIERGWYYPKI
jgi:hypothetical protein